MKQQHQQLQDNDPLDGLLAEHFSAELDRHVGRARERFATYAGPGPARPISLVAPAQRVTKNANRMRWQIWWALPAAAAAAVAMMLFPIFRATEPSSPLTRKTDPRTSIVPPHTSTGETIKPVENDVTGSLTWQVRDGGMVWLDDGTPARRVLKTAVQKYEWTDPTDNARIQITVPRNEVVVVSSPRY